MDKTKKFHWGVIFLILISFSLFSVMEMIGSHQSNVAFAKVIEDPHILGDSDTSVLFPLSIPASRSRIAQDALQDGAMICMPNRVRMPRLGTLFAKQTILIDGHSFVSLRAHELLDPEIQAVFSAFNQDDFDCTSHVRRRIPLVPIFHVS